MSENTGSKVSYFLVGLGVGAVLGILFAPKSGEETREYLMDKAEQGRDIAKRRARELRERAEDMYERGKDVLSSQREQISSALEAGKEAYTREKSKAL